MDNLDNLPFPHPRHRPTAKGVDSGKSLLADINSEIEWARDKAQVSLHDLEVLRRRRSNIASYISPFRCLPVEILGNIIQLCLEDDVKLGQLIQICGTIRDIVIGMHSIWSKIYIHLPITDMLFLTFTYKVLFLIIKFYQLNH
jgi:hypothetical protein